MHTKLYVALQRLELRAMAAMVWGSPPSLSAAAPPSNLASSAWACDRLNAPSHKSQTIVINRYQSFWEKISLASASSISGRRTPSSQTCTNLCSEIMCSFLPTLEDVHQALSLRKWRGQEAAELIDLQCHQGKGDSWTPQPAWQFHPFMWSVSQKCVRDRGYQQHIFQTCQWYANDMPMICQCWSMLINVDWCRCILWQCPPPTLALKGCWGASLASPRPNA